VVRHVIVSPGQVDVVAPVPQRPGVKATARMMTMTSCHPKFSAQQRYVVFSELTQTLPKSAGVIPDVLP
jgi:sortase A